MTGHRNDHHPALQHGDRPDLPPELAAIAAGLDDIAEQDRRSAPRGLEDRVYERSRPVLSAGAPSLKFPSARVWRVAAAVAICGTAGLIGAYMVHTGGAGPSPASEPVGWSDETVLAALQSLDAEAAAWMSTPEAPGIGVAGDLSNIESQLAAVEVGLIDFWSPDPLAEEEDAL